MAEDVALLHEHPQHLVEMEVRAADRGRRHADDRVRRLLDRRVRDLFDADVALAVEGECLHHSIPSSGKARAAAFT
jgi:hypothetical protein